MTKVIRSKSDCVEAQINDDQLCTVKLLFVSKYKEGNLNFRKY